MDVEKDELLEQLVAFLDAKNYTGARNFLIELYPIDIAGLLSELSPEQMCVAYRILPKDIASDVFVNMDSDMQEILIKGFSDKELREVMSDLYMDDMVDIIDEMPSNVVKRIILNSDPDTRQIINELLAYPEDSAGTIMTTEYVALRSTMTVVQAFERIRQVGTDKETIYTCYVTDEKRTLLGIVSVKTLLLASPEAVIGDLMETNVIFVYTYDDKEEAANTLSKYDFLALPVVDKEQRIVGIVTVDDAIDVIQDEATEDIEKMAAITPSDKPYLKTGVFSIWCKRIPWLLLLMISATFTSMILTHFENALAAQIMLTAFIPMLMDTAGNSGSQASVTIIRGLALNEIEPRDILSIVWKEFRVAILCGVTLSALNFVKLLLLDRVPIEVAAVVCLTLVTTVIFAKIVGCSLPVAAKALKFDPAVMASPFITTIVDALSLLVYFYFATLMLNL
ncbi:MAG: magnesium transporter [Eubacteriales bacterium]|nr:magnesium transporter [Eubacteriales bacterium]